MTPMSKYLSRIGRRRKKHQKWKRINWRHHLQRRKLMKRKSRWLVRKGVTVSNSTLMRVRIKVRMCGRRHRRFRCLIWEKCSFCSSCMNKKSAYNMSSIWKSNKKRWNCYNSRPKRRLKPRHFPTPKANLKKLPIGRRKARSNNHRMIGASHLNTWTSIWWWTCLLPKSRHPALDWIWACWPRSQKQAAHKTSKTSSCNTWKNLASPGAKH